ncbi:hypothetical protein PAMP_013257 [Pampus punctatissimus]
MEEENLCSSLVDITDSVLQQSQQDPCASTDHLCINGEHEAVVWSETEMQINEEQGTEQLHLSPEEGQESPEEAEQWEQIIWPMHPINSPSLSFATVQWDIPGTTSETPSFITDSSLANELDSCDVMNLDITSLPLEQSQDISAELVIDEGREEQDWFESWLFLNSDAEFAGNDSKPRDAVDVQEPATQEKEESTHELLDGINEILLSTDSEEEEGYSVASDAVETVDLIDILEDTEGSEGDSIIDLRPEEEQEEAEVLLTGQTDSEEEKTSVNSVDIKEESEEGGKVEEEPERNVSWNEESGDENTVSLLSDVEAPIEPQQTDNTALTINPDELINLQQLDISEESLHSGTKEDIVIPEQLDEDEEPEMCEDVDQKVDPKQSEDAQQQDDNEEPSIQEADEAERIENTQEILESTGNLEHTDCSEQQDSDQMTPQDIEPTMQPENSESEPSMSHLLQQLEESLQMETTEQSTQPANVDQLEDSSQLERTVCVEAEDPGVVEQQEQNEQTEKNEQTLQTTDLSQPAVSEQPVKADKTDESEITEQLCPETEVAQQTAKAELNQEMSHQEEEVGGTVVANGEQPKPETVVPHMNGGDVEREMARRLAERLHKLDGIHRVDVVKHIDKDNDFSRTVGEEYLKFFDFTGGTLDHALRSFLKVVILIGETQERERVLQHFSCRFHHCNPDTFCSSEAVLALTCALMLLNTDLHGQNVGKCMSSSKFVSNLDRMNNGENFNKDLLKSLYNSIKSEPLQWAVDEEELKNSVFLDDDAGEDTLLRSKSNPFQDVPHDKNASVIKQGFLQRKLLADIDGKRTPWGKRSWKTFCGVLRGMVLYLQKDDYRREQQINEEVVSVHHSLAEQAANYTKKPHVFRLQTADWRVFLFQATSKVEMNSWISRINLVSALHSSPPFPAAVGSQRRFCRPILPASQSAQTLERQLQSHARMLESFKADLSYLQQNPPEGKKAKAKDLEEHRVRAEYLQHEMCRYEIYIQMLKAWKSLTKTDNGVLSSADLNLFDKAVCADSVDDEEEEGGLKKSYSSPSLELEVASTAVIKVRRNISERRTYRKTIIPRRNKDV